MLKVGVTGGLATGKTFVCEQLKKLGCYYLNADEIGKQALEPKGEAYKDVVHLFGQTILREDGTIDRKRLAAIVFADSQKLKQLTDIVHPIIFKRQDELIQEIASRDPHAIIVVEAAVLFEAGSRHRYDVVVVVTCRPEQQIERALARGFTREEAEARIRNQWPQEEKIKRADFVVDTSGTELETIEQVQRLYERLVELERRKGS